MKYLMMIRMPYKDIENRRRAYRRWYWRHHPKSKDDIIEKNKKWNEDNRERHLEHQRKYNKKKWEQNKEEGRCARCSAIIEEDEQILNHSVLCESCKTINNHREKLRRKGHKFKRVV